MTELAQIREIETLCSRYGLRTFVETGCYKGDGIETAKRLGLRDIWSCDIGQTWVDQCRQRHEGAHIVHGLSTEALPEMCQGANGPTLFFLDAHLPEMYGTQGLSEDHKMPVVDELKLIRRHKKGYADDVIIVDDTRIIKSDDNPRWTPGETICCEPIVGISIMDVVGQLADTHFSHHWLDNEGYIVFKPRLHAD